VYYIIGDLEDEMCSTRTVPLYVGETCKPITTISSLSPLIYHRSLSANSLGASCTRSSPLLPLQSCCHPPLSCLLLILEDCQVVIEVPFPFLLAINLSNVE